MSQDKQKPFSNKLVKDILKWFQLCEGSYYVYLVYVDGEFWDGEVNEDQWDSIVMDIFEHKIKQLSIELESIPESSYILLLRKTLKG